MAKFNKSPRSLIRTAAQGQYNPFTSAISNISWPEFLNYPFPPVFTQGQNRFFFGAVQKSRQGTIFFAAVFYKTTTRNQHFSFFSFKHQLWGTKKLAKSLVQIGIMIWVGAAAYEMSLYADRRVPAVMSGRFDSVWGTWKRGR